jgi:general stress protein 26
MAFSYKNKKGDTYYLHSRAVTLRGSGKSQTIYFFARKEDKGVMDALPDGYMVKEVERTGLPVLKKK